MSDSLNLDFYISQVTQRVSKNLPRPSMWKKFVGYRGDIETSLIDAVYSLRYAYNTKNGKGLTPKIDQWKDSRKRKVFSCGSLIAEIDNCGGPKAWTAINFTNHKLSGRLKAEIVYEAAVKLKKSGFDRSNQVNLRNLDQFLKILESVKGISTAGSHYVAMLLGFKGETKPDRMIHNFIIDATGYWFTNLEAIEIIQASARQIGEKDVRKLDHAIWSFQRELQLSGQRSKVAAPKRPKQ